MTIMKQRLLLVLIVALLPLVVKAYDVKIDGIFYNLISKAKVAEVTHGDNQFGVDMYKGDISIPEKVEYNGVVYNVTVIADSTFYNSQLSTLVIPKSIISIKNYSFYGCYISRLDISDIGAWCNIDFGNLEAFPLYHTKHFYLNGEEVLDLVIPNGITTIKPHAFCWYTGLRTVKMPDTITSIGSAAFQNCLYLLDITFSRQLTSIGNAAFQNCKSLKTILLPDEIITIPEKTFQYCTSLESVSLGNKVQGIEAMAFQSCSNLKSINFPRSVSFVGSAAFDSCIKLTSATFPSDAISVMLGEFAFSSCESLETVEIPNVWSISKGAFKNCTHLKSVTFLGAFKYGIAESFVNCKDLSDVFCHDTSVPTATKTAFKDSYIEYATLHVPAKSLEDYKTTEPWSGFGKIVPLDDYDEPDDPVTPDDPSTPDNPVSPDNPSANTQGGFLEYFIDIDPGYGKANKVKEISAENNELEFELGSVMPGAHMLYVRSIDEQGRWSTTISRPLYVRQPVSVIALEYFFDGADPGLGKAVPVVLPRDSKDEFSFEVAIKGLAAGDHQICLRSKNSDGIWSIVSKEQFSLTEETGIDVIDAERSPSITYTLKGYRSNGQKGINIVHYKDGTTQKVIIK